MFKKGNGTVSKTDQSLLKGIRGSPEDGGGSEQSFRRTNQKITKNPIGVVTGLCLRHQEARVSGGVSTSPFRDGERETSWGTERISWPVPPNGDDTL